MFLLGIWIHYTFIIVIMVALRLQKPRLFLITGPLT